MWEKPLEPDYEIGEVLVSWEDAQPQIKRIIELVLNNPACFGEQTDDPLKQAADTLKTCVDNWH